MKIFYFFLFLTLLSCNNLSKKKYVCGDHLCIDKKEFNEYFSKNLTMEVLSTNKNKKQSVDLVKLNTDSLSLKSQKEISANEDKFLKEIEKEKLKTKKTKLLKEKKNKKIQKKITTSKNKQITKRLESQKNKTIIDNNEISNNRSDKKKNIKKASLQQNNNKTEIIDNEVEVNTIKITNSKSICVEINDCDIDKISEILTKKGREKPFPSITSN